MTDNGGTASVEMDQGGNSPIPVRATETVSMRDIAAGDGDVDGSGRLMMTDLASARNISGRRFALRELITSQETDAASTVASSSEQWVNWLHEHGSDAVRYRPKTPDDLRAVVAETARNRDKIRAVGAGHSHTKVAKPVDSGRYVQLSWYCKDESDPAPGCEDANGREVRGLVGLYDRPWQPDQDDLDLTYTDLVEAESDETPRLVRAAAGNPLKYLNRHVLLHDDHLNEGHALFNMGSYDAQSLAGAINTSTHGTGQDFGTLADTVVSVELLTVMDSAAPDTPVVRKFRIEPTDGVTNRGEFEDDVGEHGMTLIQNDEVFHSTVVGYGCMGIATAYTIQVRPKFFIRETTKIHTWEKLKDQTLRDYLDRGDIHHLQLLVNVASVYDDLKLFGQLFDDPEDLGINLAPKTKCMVRYHERVPWKEKSDAPNFPNDETWPPERISAQSAFRKARKKISGGGGLDPFSPNPFFGWSINNIYFPQQTKPPFKGDVASRGVLGGSGRYSTASYIALRRLADARGKQVRRAPPDPADQALTMEHAIPIEKAENVVEDILQWITEVEAGEEVFRNINWPITKLTLPQEVRFPVPMGVRFVKDSNHKFTAENRDGPVVMVEPPFNVMPIDNSFQKRLKALQHTVALSPIDIGRLDLEAVTTLFGTGIPQLVEWFTPRYSISSDDMKTIARDAYSQLEERIMDEYDARPHLGKINDLSPEQLRRTYPGFDTWQSVHREFNAFGTFNNDFSDQYEFSIERVNGQAVTRFERRKDI